jgi:hypothetical protein
MRQGVSIYDYNRVKQADKQVDTPESYRKIYLHRNNRGFLIGQFHDLNEEPCSIQESSYASQPAVWLGRDTSDPNVYRMHLTQEMAQALIDHLQVFVATGKLKENNNGS